MTSIAPIRPLPSRTTDYEITETATEPAVETATEPAVEPAVEPVLGILETDAKTFVSKYFDRYKDQFSFMKNVKLDSSKLALMVILGAALLFIANGIYTLVALAIAIAVAMWAFGKIMNTTT